MGLIQEHFKKDGAELFDLFGPAWWNLSSGAVGESGGRRSGGCAIFGQPSLATDQGFQHRGGRICGLFVSGGLLLSIYFPTKKPKQTMNKYREMFTAFVDELSCVIEEKMANHHVSWMACGADLNAHFAGCGLPPRRKDDHAARELRRFMSRFNFVSLALELCPDRFTRLNSRGGTSCLDTFLVSRDLYESGHVTSYEVLDFLEHGSDHSPVYIRLKVYPSWVKRSKPPRRRILKSSGIEELRRKLEGDESSRCKVVSTIVRSFSNLRWTEAKTREDMNGLWEVWVDIFNSLVEDLIGTRWARISSWGRKFDMEVRVLCKEASIARSWFVETKRAGREVIKFYTRWKQRREKFIAAWERSNTEWHIDCVKRAIGGGDTAVWRLLSDNWKVTSRPIIDDNNNVLTNPGLVHDELLRFHQKSKSENSSIPPGGFEPVKWDEPFMGDDEVLVIADNLVLKCLLKLKNSSVPDNMTPLLLKFTVW